MKFFSRKYLIAIALIGLVLLPIALNSAHAADAAAQNNFSCSDNLVTCAVYFVSWLINVILKGAIIVSAGLVAGILALDGQVYASPVVQTGFSVTLALTNLGFVLAIIVIAIATILRNQTYGIKQMLWKLVLMAILVNFGLVITRPILQTSDSLSNYFLQPMNGPSGFVTNVTNAFAPQKLPGGGAANADSGTNGSATAGAAGGAVAGALICGTAAVVTTPIGGILCMAGYTVGGYFLGGAAGSVVNLFSGNFNDVLVAAVLSLIFSAIFLFIVAFSLLALFVMMTIRYVYITFLLVLLPLAWLAWVFPGLNSHFAKWWHLFLRWTFFPAIALFFMYLTLLMVPVNGTGNDINAISEGLQVTTTGASNDPATASTNLGALMIQEVVLCGLMLGGLYAANSLGIAGAGAAMGYAAAAGKWVGGKASGAAGRQGKKAAAGLVNENMKKKLQSGGYRGVPKRLQVATGIGLANIQKAGGSSLVDQEAAWAKEQGKDPLAAHRMLGSGGLSETKKLALLKVLNDNKKFDPDKLKNGVDGVKGQDINTLLGDKDRFEKYGQGSLRDDLNKSIHGAPAEAVAAANALAQGKDRVKYDGDDLEKAADGTVDALELLQKSLEKSAKTMDKGSLGKMNLGYMFGNGLKNADGTENKSAKLLRKEFMKQIMLNKPQLIPSMMPKMNQEQLKNLTEIFSDGISESRNETQVSNKTTEEKDILSKHFDKVEKSFESAMGKNMMGLIPEEKEEKPEASHASSGEKK